MIDEGITNNDNMNRPTLQRLDRHSNPSNIQPYSPNSINEFEAI